MKAALWYDREKIKIEEVEEPFAKKGQVKIKVKWCGLCGSDIHEYLDGPIAIPVSKPHPLSGKTAPVILGHELSGEIVEVGEGVTKFKVGDRIALEPNVVCGECNACKEGTYNLCLHIGFHGLCGTGGGFAEFTTYPVDFVHKIPDSISYEKAALIEPIAVALHSLEVGNFTVGQSALVIGAGPIGLVTIEALKAAGAKTVIVVQRTGLRQEMAKLAGADVVLDPEKEDVVSKIKEMTDGGVDIAFEVAGTQSGLDIGLQALRFAGTFVITSIWGHEIKFNPNDIVYKEINMIGTIGSKRNFPMAIDLMADGRIKADYCITKRISLDNIIEEGINTLTGPEKKKHAKIIVTPEKELLDF